MSDKPLVSCLCCTYGRPVLLGETLKCFLDQSYSNKELIIVNDQEGVTLKLESDYPGVQLHNCSKRFDSLGQKRNYVKSLAKGEFYCIWDDDDLYAPFRLSDSVDLMNSIKDYDIMKTRCAFMSTHNKDYRIVSNLFHSQSVITKDYAVRFNYPDKSVGEDMDFENKARVYNVDVIPWYVYRWGLNIHHLSGISDEKESWKRTLTFESYQGMSGEIVIKPEFKNNYWSEIRSVLVKTHPKWARQWDEKTKNIA